LTDKKSGFDATVCQIPARLSDGPVLHVRWYASPKISATTAKAAIMQANAILATVMLVNLHSHADTDYRQRVADKAANEIARHHGGALIRGRNLIHHLQTAPITKAGRHGHDSR
jgi:hypothetical protein